MKNGACSSYLEWAWVNNYFVFFRSYQYESCEKKRVRCLHLYLNAGQSLKSNLNLSDDIYGVAMFSMHFAMVSHLAG